MGWVARGVRDSSVTPHIFGSKQQQLQQALTSPPTPTLPAARQCTPTAAESPSTDLLHRWRGRAWVGRTQQTGGGRGSGPKGQATQGRRAAAAAAASPTPQHRRWHLAGRGRLAHWWYQNRRRHPLLAPGGRQASWHGTPGRKERSARHLAPPGHHVAAYPRHRRLGSQAAQRWRQQELRQGLRQPAKVVALGAVGTAGTGGRWGRGGRRGRLPCRCWRWCCRGAPRRRAPGRTPGCCCCPRG